MLDERMIAALLISSVLAILIFRTNYNATLAIQRQKYINQNSYNYGLLILDIVTTVIFALIGCYLAWDSITGITGLQEYSEYKFLISILTGVLFQQILPIIIEIIMNKINQFRDKQLGKIKQDEF